MADIKDDVIIVTGASRGMGREMSLRFSKEGAKVVLVSRTKEKLEDVAEEAENEVLVSPTNVRSAEDVVNTVETTFDEFGKVDTLVNNAGIAFESLNMENKIVENITEEEWDKVIETNLKGPFLFTREVITHMKERNQGNIINVSSMLAGEHVIEGETPYLASKWGLESFIKASATEYEDYGINVNGLMPGGLVGSSVYDDLSEGQRESLLPTDVLNDAAVLLAAQEPDGITGESLVADEWEERLAI